jgi:exopolysaccharide biosynthesis polyprenyl glycosylphosphotransferase
MLTLGRYAGLIASWNVERHWPISERVAVIADHSGSHILIDRIRHFGGVLAGLIVPPGTEEEGDLAVPVLGSTSKLAELINSAKIDRLILLEHQLTQEQIYECCAISKRMGVIVTRVIGLAEPDARPAISERYGLRLLELKPILFTQKQEFLKRTFDVVCSAVLLVLLAPLLAAIAILVKATSRGPVLYCSNRVGRGGRHFQFLKFRSMFTGMEDRRAVAALNEKKGHIFKIKNDPRVTPIGRILRRTSMDELPQLVNVLLGHMSMVGPRPLPAHDLDPDGQSKDFRTWAEQRSRVVPGITGLWQIRGRSELPFEKMVELDVQYIREWSLALDLRILLETPVVLVTGRGAY